MKKNVILLGVNIDHVATIREARKTRYPDPLQAMYLAEDAGADGITMHLREDRRHIQERDVALAMQCLTTRLNLECAVTDSMIAMIEKYNPPHVCFVPEKREELTTEGGLDVLQHLKKITEVTARLKTLDIEVSLFIDPDLKQIQAAIDAKAPVIEIHTGAYADAENAEQRQSELERIIAAAKFAHENGLVVNAGHGLHYHNVQAIAAIPYINELNIGHSIVARALFSGFSAAVAEMKKIMVDARQFS